MKVVVLNPLKVFVAGIISCLLIVGSVLGVLTLWGVFSSEPAQAVEAAAAGEKIWYFAEGYTGPGFEEWILLYNPESGINHIEVQVRYYGPGGFIGYSVHGIDPGQRLSINVNDLLMSNYGYSGDVSVEVKGQYPFLCERALYFDYKGQWTGGSHSSGYSTSSL